MVMSALRDRIKIVILVTLAAFVGLIFFDWGMQQTGGSAPDGAVAGRVNGREITDEMYRRTYQSLLSSFESRAGRAPEGSDFSSIEEEAWITLVQEMLLQEQIEKYGISVTDAEILEVLHTNPPEFVRANFVDEQGQFDATQYQQALAQAASDPAVANFWTQVEALIRATAPSDKVRNYVGLGARVTTAEARRRFLDRNEKVRVRYVASTSADVQFDDQSITEADARAWYDAHPTDFRVGEQAVLHFVRVSKAPTALDSSEARQDLEHIREAVLAGADFAEEARSWSDDPSADRGGDLGLFGRGDMVPEFEQVAFALNPGEVSEVFSTPFGYHLVKVEEKTNEGGVAKVRARHILVRVEPSNETLQEARTRIEEFLTEVEEGGGFEDAAASAGLTVEVTPPFERGSFVSGPAMIRAAQIFAFGAQPGTVSDSPVEDDRSVYAYRLADRRPGGVLPFEDVKDRARLSCAEERRGGLARQKLEQAVSASGGALASIARAMGASPDTTEEFTRESFVPGIGRRNAFVAAAFALPVGQRSEIIGSDRGFYVLEVLARTPADEAAFAEQRNQIRGELLMERRQTLVTAWMEELLVNAEIEDFRRGGKSVWKPDDADLVYAKLT
jgi:parvulin-like peptidyl-prolyl isomerase